VDTQVLRFGSPKMFILFEIVELCVFLDIFLHSETWENLLLINESKVTLYYSQAHMVIW
jgi:hypothetical protein